MPEYPDPSEEVSPKPVVDPLGDTPDPTDDPEKEPDVSSMVDESDNFDVLIDSGDPLADLDDDDGEDDGFDDEMDVSDNDSGIGAYRARGFNDSEEEGFSFEEATDPSYVYRDNGDDQ